MRNPTVKTRVAIYGAGQYGLEAMRNMHCKGWENKYGKHQYSLEQYGLTPEGIRETLSEYESFNADLDASWGF